jgi:hypothetical protein
VLQEPLLQDQVLPRTSLQEATLLQEPLLRSFVRLRTDLRSHLRCLVWSDDLPAHTPLSQHRSPK